MPCQLKHALWQAHIASAFILELFKVEYSHVLEVMVAKTDHYQKTGGQMPLIQLVLVLVVVGLVLWVINSYIPMQSTIKEY